MGGKSELRVDRAKNRLYIKLSGFFRGADVEPAMRDLEAAVRDLRPGFDTVTDLSSFVPGSPGAGDALTRAGELLRAKGRRRGVRITGGLITGLMQFQRLLKGVFSDEHTRFAKSLREADEILDSWPEEG
ncbi:MAG: hypothetical protein MUC56_13630 [Thermoanaerobaculales bacterium]|jgi:hypothetical protein|nr:hypothetical protein [Thermoanaerobaculales bacterium]